MNLRKENGHTLIKIAPSVKGQNGRVTETFESEGIRMEVDDKFLPCTRYSSPWVLCPLLRPTSQEG